MALIAMCCYDTESNDRTKYTKRTLFSLDKTVDFTKHRLFIVDNASCKATKHFLSIFQASHPDYATLITLDSNIGTAEAINYAWKNRQPGENCIKMDNDVVINQQNWVEEMEAVILRDPEIGQVGLKRKDCWENPEHPDPHYKSELLLLPHKVGESWIIVENVNHVMGTCVMHSSALLDAVGYLKQPKVYGFDDALMSYRSKLAGFKNVFLSHIDIDHIDTGDNIYQKEKERIANESWSSYHKYINGYKTGLIPLYYNPYE